MGGVGWYLPFESLFVFGSDRLYSRFYLQKGKGGLEPVNAYGLIYSRSQPSSASALAITLLSLENHRLTPVPEETQAQCRAPGSSAATPAAPKDHAASTRGFCCVVPRAGLLFSYTASQRPRKRLRLRIVKEDGAESPSGVLAGRSSEIYEGRGYWRICHG